MGHPEEDMGRNGSSQLCSEPKTRSPPHPQFRWRCFCCWQDEGDRCVSECTMCEGLFKLSSETSQASHLSDGKKLLTPQPRLRTGFFSVLESNMLTPTTIKEACSSVGVSMYGRAIGLDEKIKVDLIVIGSVAVDPKTGARLGKGEGFAELEYGMLRYMGAIDDSTPVVTYVHDCQLVNDIPVEKMLIHDVPVYIICTPFQVIFTHTSIPKPQGGETMLSD